MRPARGMGAVAPSKMPKPKQVVRKDKPQDVTVFKDGEVWDKSRPKDLGTPQKLTAAKKAKAKAIAKAAGRTYPNLIDNMRAARKK